MMYIVDGDKFQNILNTYTDFISGLITNIHNVTVLGKPNPNMEKYILENQSRIVKNINNYIMNAPKLLGIQDVTSSTTIPDSGRVIELDGGKKITYYKFSKKKRVIKKNQNKKSSRVKTK